VSAVRLARCHSTQKLAMPFMQRLSRLCHWSIFSELGDAADDLVKPLTCSYHYCFALAPVRCHCSMALAGSTRLNNFIHLWPYPGHGYPFPGPVHCCSPCIAALVPLDEAAKHRTGDGPAQMHTSRLHLPLQHHTFSKIVRIHHIHLLINGQLQLQLAQI
jgi:hypothetical protein